MNADGRPALIGWKEYIDLPAWGLHGVKVKIDTGARTTALGAARYEVVAAAGGRSVRLHLALYRRRPRERAVVEVPVIGEVVVRNSGGVSQARPVVETTVRLGGVAKPVRMTVTDRSRMLFPIILGRKALEGDFVVDVSRKYVQRAAGGGR